MIPSLFSRRFFYKILIVMLLWRFIDADENIVSSPKPSLPIPSQFTSLAVVFLDYETYYFTAGGIHEFNDSLSKSTERKLRLCLDTLLKKKGYAIKHYEEDVIDTEVIGAQHLYRSVQSSIAQHIYGTERFATSIKHLDYSIGSIERLCERYQVDGILYVIGYNEISTHLRRVVKGEAAAGAIAGAILSAFIGIGGGISLRTDLFHLNGGLVDKKGAIRWYNQLWQGTRCSNIQHEDAKKYIESLFRNFPRKGRRS